MVRQSLIYQGKARYLVNEAILHCAALSAGQVKTFAKLTAKQILAEIDRWHRIRGFSRVGYHGIFLPTGEFIQGRLFTEIGAHCIERNRGSIGFLMIESKPITRMGVFEDWFTERQRVAVRAKIKSLDGIKWVTGHNDYANKLCPGFEVKQGDWL